MSKSRDSARPRTTLKRRSMDESVLALEPRYLLDAAAVATGAEAAVDQVAQEQANAAVAERGAGAATGTDTSENTQDVMAALTGAEPASQRQEVAFVDTSIDDYQTLVAGIGSNVEVVLLDTTRDGLAQMVSALDGRSGLDAIHIISHGHDARLDLGSTTLTAESMATDAVADQLAAIGASLGAGADILIYGCNFGRGDAGQAAAELMSALTGADVAASTDNTGHEQFDDSNWTLELETGAIETQVAVSAEAQAQFTSVLVPVVTINSSFEDYVVGSQPGPVDAVNGPLYFRNNDALNEIDIVDDSLVPGWETTDPQGLEVAARVETSVTATAGNGNQFAELNAFIAGTLTQTVSTTPGQIVHYEFWHRGRAGNDTMNMIIWDGVGTTGIVLRDPNQGAAPAGVTRQETSGTASGPNGDGWQRYRGTFQAQTPNTTIGFQAVSSSTGGLSQGNLLDGIQLVTPSIDTVSGDDIVVAGEDAGVTFTGDGVFNDSTVTLTVSDGTTTVGPVAVTVQPDGTWATTAPVDISGLAEGRLNVELTEVDSQINTLVENRTILHAISDADEDGIVDFEDIDSDNDGIIDAIELVSGGGPATREVIFTEDFGSGAANPGTDIVPTTGYIPITNATPGQLDDGEYALTNNAEPLLFSPGTWNSTPDNTTGDTDGYYLALGGSERGEEVFRLRIGGLIPYSTVEVSAAVLNLLAAGRPEAEPLLTFELRDVDDATVLASESRSGFASDEQWRDVTTQLQIAAETTVDLVIINDQDTGVAGNDIGIDDIVVTALLPDLDGDTRPDYLDIDVDNDGIPDNIEAQATATYLAPSGAKNLINDAENDGLDDNYDADGTADALLSAGLTPVDTDTDGVPDYRDNDSDNDGILDIVEKPGSTVVSGSDQDSDGLDDNFEQGDPLDGYIVNDGFPDADAASLGDSDNDLPNANGDGALPRVADVDFRDRPNPGGVDGSKVWLRADLDVAEVTGAELITNGDFTTDASSWTLTGSVAHDTADGGVLAFNVGGGALTGFADQTVATTAGTEYRVQADVDSNPAGSATAAIEVQILDAATGLVLATQQQPAGRRVGVAFTASGANTIVRFVDRSSDGTGVDATIDNVTMQALSAGTDGAQVDFWGDQLGLSDGFRQGGDPTLSVNALNFNEVVEFDGATDFLETGLDIDQVEAFVVADPRNTGVSVGFAEDASSTFGYWQRQGADGVADAVSIGDRFAAPTTGRTATDTAGPSGYFVHNATIDGADTQISIDGTAQSVTNFAGGASVVTGAAQLRVGSGSNGGADDFDGGIAEVLVFEQELTAAERERVNSYLAVKYGITLGHDYRDSNGNTVYTLGAYGNDVAGIQRDDGAALHQRISGSINVGATAADGPVLVVSTDTNFTDANTTHTDLAAGQSLVWGHDGDTADALTAQVLDDGNSYEVMDRVWQYQDVGAIGAVNLQFDLSALGTFSGDSTVVLVTSPNATFGDGDDVSVAATVSGGGVVTVAGVDLDDNATAFFTLAALDTDRDGVEDGTDIDDDNDGIIDSREAGGVIDLSGGVNFASRAVNVGDGTVNVTGTVVSNVSGAVAGNANGDIIMGDSSVAVPNPPDAATGDEYRLDFDQPVEVIVSNVSAPVANFDGVGSGGDEWRVSGPAGYTAGFSVSDPDGQLEIQAVGPDFVEFRPVSGQTIAAGTGTWSIVSNDPVTQITLQASGNNLSAVNVSLGDSDSDGDGVVNRLDLDSDDDGIPDNVEAQGTGGYVLPPTTFAPATDDADRDGLLDVYETGTFAADAGIVPVDSDASLTTGADGIPDFLDTDSDADGTLDADENGLAANTPGADTDGDGYGDNYESDAFRGGNANDAYDYSNDAFDPNPTTLGDNDADLSADGNTRFDGTPVRVLIDDVDFRDVNFLPSLDLNTAVTETDLNRDFEQPYLEGDPAVFVADNTLADFDDSGENDVASLVITLAGFNDAAQEQVTLNGTVFTPGTPNTIAGATIGGQTANIAFDGTVFTITPDGGSVFLDAAGLDTLIRGIQYQHLGTTGTGGPRTLTFVASDALGSSRPVEASIVVAARDDAPVGVADVDSITEDAAPNTTAGDVVSGPGTDTDADGHTVLAFDMQKTDQSAQPGGGAAGPVETSDANDVAGDYGTLDWSFGGGYTYTLDNSNPFVNELGPGDSLTETFTYTPGNGAQPFYVESEFDHDADLAGGTVYSRSNIIANAGEQLFFSYRIDGTGAPATTMELVLNGNVIDTFTTSATALTTRDFTDFAVPTADASGLNTLELRVQGGGAVPAGLSLTGLDIQNQFRTGAATTLTITIDGVDDDPVIDLNSAVDPAIITPTSPDVDNRGLVANEGTELPIAPAGGVSDRGDEDITQLTITLSNFTDGNDEELRIGTAQFPVATDVTTGTTSVTFGGTMFDVAVSGNVFTITNAAGAATPMDEAALSLLVQDIRYINTAGSPDTATTRQLDFELTDSTGNMSLTAVADLTVTAVDGPPVAVDDGPIAVPPAIATIVAPMGNDFDPDGQTISISQVFDPAAPGTPIVPVVGTPIPLASGAVITLQANNTFEVVIPPPGGATTYTFNYTVDDSTGATSNEATVTLVQSTPGFPPVVDLSGPNVRLDNSIGAAVGVAPVTTPTSGIWDASGVVLAPDGLTPIGPSPTQSISAEVQGALPAGVTVTFGTDVDDFVISVSNTSGAEEQVEILWRAWDAAGGAGGGGNQLANADITFITRDIEEGERLDVGDTGLEAARFNVFPSFISGQTGSTIFVLGEPPADPTNDDPALRYFSYSYRNIDSLTNFITVQPGDMVDFTFSANATTDLDGDMVPNDPDDVLMLPFVDPTRTSILPTESGMFSAPVLFPVDLDYSTFFREGTGVAGAGSTPVPIVDLQPGQDIDINGNPVPGPVAVNPTLDADFTLDATATGFPISVADADSPAYSEISIVLVNAQPGDVLSTSGVPASFAAPTADVSTPGQIRYTLTLANPTVGASTADVSAAIASFTFDNTSDNPDTTQREVDVQLTDFAIDPSTGNPIPGIQGPIAKAFIDIALTNDPPIITLDASGTTLDATGTVVLPGGDLDHDDTFTEGGAATPLADTDENVDLTGENDVVRVTIDVTGDVDTGSEFLFLGGQLVDISQDLATQGIPDPIVAGLPSGAGLRITFDGNQIVIEDRDSPGTGTFLPSDIDTAISFLTYENTSDNPTPGDRTFTFNAIDDDGQPSTTPAISTITVQPVNDPPVAENDTGTFDGSATTLNVLTNTTPNPADSDIDDGIDTGSVQLIMPAGATAPAPGGATAGDPVTAYTVPGQGTWTVGAGGDVTFTPDDGGTPGDTSDDFTGTPDVATYVVSDVGGLVSNQATITLSDTAPPVALDDSTSFTGGTTPVFDLVANDAAGERGTGDGINLATLQFRGAQPGGALPSTTTTADDTLAVPGEGTWTINSAAGTITFVPEAGFTGKPSDVSYGFDDNAGNPSNNALFSLDDVAMPATVDDTANFDAAAGAVTLDVAANDGVGELAGSPLGRDIDAGSIVFVVGPSTAYTATDITAGGAQLVIPGEGTWTVDGGGNVTFDPQIGGTPTGFAGLPTPVYYTIDDNAATPNTSAATEIRLSDTSLPIAVDDTRDFTGVAITIETQTGDPANANDGSDIAANPSKTLLPDSVQFENLPVGAALNGDGSYTVANEGTWSIDPANGNITFDPVDAGGAPTNFRGTPTPIQYSVADDQGPGGTAGNRSAPATITLNDRAIPVGVPDAGVYTGVAITGIDVTALLDGSGPGAVANGGADGFGENGTPGIAADSLRLTDSGNAAWTLTPDGLSLTIPDEGVWTVVQDGAGPGTLTFTPNVDGNGLTFTGRPSPIEYTIADDQANTSLPIGLSLSDAAIPPATPDTDNFDGTTTVVAVLANDAATGETLDETTVEIQGASGPGTPLFVANEGTWSVLPSGALQFEPLPGFASTPTVISYRVSDDATPLANQSPYVTVTLVDTAPPGAMDDLAAAQPQGPVSINVPGNDANGGPVNITTVQFVDPQPGGVGVVSNGGRTLTIAGEGAFDADATTGVVTFTPEPTFTGDPSVVTYQIADDQGITATATITVDYVPISADDTAPAPGTLAAAVTTPVSIDVLNNDDAGDTPVPGSVRLIDDAGNEVTTYTVTGEGTWSVDTVTGEVSFTADAALTTDPTPVNYVVRDDDGNVSDPASITIDFTDTNQPLAVNDTLVAQDRSGTPAGERTIDVLANDQVGAGGALEPTRVSLVVPAGATSTADGDGDVTSVTVPGEGTWTVNATSGEITFAPGGGFSDDPTPISYTVRDAGGTLSNPAVVTIDYVPVATDDTGVFGGTNPVTVNVLANDTGGDALDTTSVRLLDGSGSPVTTLDVLGEGTWSVAGPNVTFTPVPTFTGTPTPQTYEASDDDGNKVTATITLTESATPLAVDDVGDFTGVAVTVPASANDGGGEPLNLATLVFTADDGAGNALPAGAALDTTANTVTVPGEGVWSTDGAGNVIFTPEPGFTGKPSDVYYEITDTATPTPVTSNRATISLVDMASPQIPPPDPTDPDPPFTGPPLTIDPPTTSGPPGGPGEPLDPNCLQFVGTANPGDDLVVPGEGTWSINASDQIVFTAEPGFTGNPSEVQYFLCDSDGNPTDPIPVDPGDGTPPVANDDMGSYDTQGAPVTVNALDNDGPGENEPLNEGSIVFEDPAAPGTFTGTLTLAGEGTWSSDATTGVVTFTPEANFTGPVTPVGYTVEDASGNTSNVATITLDDNVEPLPPSVPTPPDFGPDPADPDGPLPPVVVDIPLDPSDPNGPSEPLDPASKRFDPTGAPAGWTFTPDNRRLEIPGEGVWEVIDVLDAGGNVVDCEVVFTPDPTFTGDPSPVPVIIDDPDGNPTPPIVVDLGDQAPPVLGDDMGVYDTAGVAVEVPITVNDGLGETARTDATDATDGIDETTVLYEQPDGSFAATLNVPGEGDWTTRVDAASGEAIAVFTPVDANFTGPVTPVRYVVSDNATPANQATAPATITLDDSVEPLPPTFPTPPEFGPDPTDPDGPLPPVDIPIPLDPNDPGGPSEPLDPSSKVFVNPLPGWDLSTDGRTLIVPGEGVWTVELVFDPADPTVIIDCSVRFTPDPTFTGEPTPPEIQVSDPDGNPTPPTPIPLGDSAPPVLQPDDGLFAGGTTSLPVTGNDGAGENAAGTPGIDMDPTSVLFEQPDGSFAATLPVPGEGTWSTDTLGNAIFTPDAGFTGPVSAVRYVASDLNSNQAREPVTITLRDESTPLPPTLPPDAVPPLIPDPTDPEGPLPPVDVPIPVDPSDPNGPSEPLDPESKRFDRTNAPADWVFNGDDTRVEVPGEGVYEVIIERDGAGNVTNCFVRFTPDDTFTGDPTPPDILIDDPDGNPTPPIPVDIEDQAPPRLVDDTGQYDGATITLDILGNDAEGERTGESPGLDVTSVQYEQPDGSFAPTLTIAGEGTWSTTPAGEAVFTPDAGFTGPVTPVGYVVNDASGNTATTPATITLEDNTPPVGPTPPAEPPEFTPDPDGPDVVFPIPTDPSDPGGPSEPLDPSSKVFVNPVPGWELSADGKTLVVPGEGTWTVVEITDATGAVIDCEVQFEADPTFTGTPTPPNVQVSDFDGNPTPPITLVTGDSAGPGLVDDTADYIGDVVTVPLTANDGAGEDEGAGASMDPTSVLYEQPDGSFAATLTVAGEGTWTTDANGNGIFTPERGFAGPVTSVRYVASDVRGNEATTPATIALVDNAEPPSVPEVSEDFDGGPLTFDPLVNATDPDGIDPTSVQLALPDTPLPPGSELAPDGLTLTVPGEGVWSVDPTTGNVTFTPEVGFTGNVSRVGFTVADTFGIRTDVVPLRLIGSGASIPPSNLFTADVAPGAGRDGGGGGSGGDSRFGSSVPSSRDTDAGDGAFGVDSSQAIVNVVAEASPTGDIRSVNTPEALIRAANEIEPMGAELGIQTFGNAVIDEVERIESLKPFGARTNFDGTESFKFGASTLADESEPDDERGIYQLYGDDVPAFMGGVAAAEPAPRATQVAAADVPDLAEILLALQGTPEAQQPAAESTAPGRSGFHSQLAAMTQRSTREAASLTRALS